MIREVLTNREDLINKEENNNKEDRNNKGGHSYLNKGAKTKVRCKATGIHVPKDLLNKGGKIRGDHNGDLKIVDHKDRQIQINLPKLKDKLGCGFKKQVIIHL